MPCDKVVQRDPFCRHDIEYIVYTSFRRNFIQLTSIFGITTLNEKMNTLYRGKYNEEEKDFVKSRLNFGLCRPGDHQGKNFLGKLLVVDGRWCCTICVTVRGAIF